MGAELAELEERARQTFNCAYDCAKRAREEVTRAQAALEAAERAQEAANQTLLAVQYMRRKAEKGD